MFKRLSEVSRHDPSKDGTYFRAVCVLVQLTIKHEHAAFQIDY